MTRWRRFLAWIDQDIGKQGWPSTHSLSSIAPIFPYILILPPLWYFDPPTTVRHWVVGIASIPAFLLFAVWAWRVFLAGRRQVREIRRSKR